MASSRAAWVLGGVRLISSAKTMFENSGPLTNLNWRDSSRISAPTMSLGMRSGVNWMRLKLNPNAWAMVLTSKVLAKPGTPTNRMWPPAKMEVVTSRMTCSWPTMTFPTSVSKASCWVRSASSADLSSEKFATVQELQGCCPKIATSVGPEALSSDESHGVGLRTGPAVRGQGSLSDAGFQTR